MGFFGGFLSLLFDFGQFLGWDFGSIGPVGSSIGPIGSSIGPIGSSIGPIG
jgi:hypothetical protein